MTHPGKVALALATSLLLAACANTGDPYRDEVRNQQTAGAIIGGVIGGVIGHQFGEGRGNTAMTAIGATAGAIIGGELARDRAISRYERDAAYMAFESAPSGRPVRWRDPDDDVYGYYTPVRTWRSTRGAYCREYQQVVVIDGREQRAWGNACRQPDGSWRIVNGGGP
ncbi:MAG: glycine zipper 2TM domain-containing protein [Rhodanobacteraceae bacterium]|nr:glycine zipper 2TM domain-containing protein [Rhodanobacteraceae bacterium]